MSNQSKPVTAQQLERMAEIGVPIYEALSKVMDISIKDVREMAESGKVLNAHVMGAARLIDKTIHYLICKARSARIMCGAIIRGESNEAGNEQYQPPSSQSSYEFLDDLNNFL